ncbi:MAG: S41 family peptidase, partial [Actinomycetota bacterium]
MERWQRYVMFGLAACVAAFALFSVGYATGRRDGSPTIQTLEAVEGSDLIQEAYDRILAESVSQPDESALARGAIRGMIETLKKENDPYAFFYSPSGYRSFQELTTGKFSGIGVWLKKKGDELIVVSVLPSTPALDAGLRSGDVISSVDGRKVSGATTDEAVAMIKGPAGTEVTIGVRRGSRSLSFDIERAQIDLPNLQARVTKEGLGYIRLFGFARNAGKQVREEVADLIDEGANGV